MLPSLTPEPLNDARTYMDKFLEQAKGLGLLSTGSVDRLEYRWSVQDPTEYLVIENGSIVFPSQIKTKCLGHDKPRLSGMAS